MDPQARAQSIITDILVNHLPRVIDGLQRGYVDENQILVIYDHAVRARILREQGSESKSIVSPSPTAACRDTNHIPRSLGGDGGPDAHCTCR